MFKSSPYERPTLAARLRSGADRRAMTDLIASLGLGTAVTVVNGADPPAVAAAMRRSTFVVVSSTRRETFCSVAAEALACGTPLVVTRCGGPEEFVTPEDGVMVEPDDPSALAAGILQAFDAAARPALAYIGHDLDAENRALLQAGRIDAIIDHDLVADARDALRAILFHHRRIESHHSSQPSRAMVSPFSAS